MSTCRNNIHIPGKNNVHNEMRYLVRNYNLIFGLLGEAVIHGVGFLTHSRFAH